MKSFIKKLENNNNISIFNFQYFSGNYQRATFNFIYTYKKINITLYACVLKKETYQESIDRVIKDFYQSKMKELIDTF